jgi:hypothetical protein
LHPEMIRAIAAQQVADMQAEARAGLRARLARQARKARRRPGGDPDPIGTVRVPDYIDGTFRTDARQAGGERREDGTASAGPAVSRDAA